MWSSPSHTNTSKIYMGKNAHRTPLGNWQKISYTTKAERKTFTKLGRREKIKKDQDGAGSRGGTFKGDKVHMGRSSSWEVHLPPGKSPGMV